MDRALKLRLLAEAEQHVALGERHIAEQEERIAKLARRGYDTTAAQNLLNTFFALQMQHIQHRDRILRELQVAGTKVHF